MIQPGMTKRKRSEHYVNNKEFLNALIAYREERELAEAKGLPRLLFPDTLESAFLRLQLTYRLNQIS